MPTNTQPIYVRLPKNGTLCPTTGLTRSYMCSLILPTKANGFVPPVISKVLRNTSSRKRGVRLILLESLLAYINEKAEVEAEAKPSFSKGVVANV